MKKLLYILAIMMTVSLSFSACTEDEVKPRSNTGNGGGGPIDSPLPGSN